MADRSELFGLLCGGGGGALLSGFLERGVLGIYIHIHFGSLELGKTLLEISFEILGGGTQRPRRAHALGALVQFVARVGSRPASVRVVRLE